MKSFLLSLFLFLSVSFYAQHSWEVTELAPMPVAVSNNAVCEGLANNHRFVYSFGGVDTTKSINGIHQNSFRYNVGEDYWELLPDIPSSTGRIGCRASFLNGKIYLIGGFHFDQNGDEVSSFKLHIFNTKTSLWEANGEDLPFAVDNHVQSIYRDSLIYVIGGKTNGVVSRKVQVYNLKSNTWQQATELPDNNVYKFFGASGAIIDDSLYYLGGGSGSSIFTAKPHLRKGEINTQNPFEVNWLYLMDLPFESVFKSVCSFHDKTLFWIGGSSKAHNFDGLAYDGSGGVEPNNRIIHFNIGWIQLTNATSELNNNFSICNIGVS